MCVGTLLLRIKSLFFNLHDVMKTVVENSMKRFFNLHYVMEWAELKSYEALPLHVEF